MKQRQDLITFKAHASHVIDLAFTPDSSYLLSAGMDNVIHQWSTHDWSLVRTYSGHDKSVNSISLISDGNRFITASSDRSLRLWELGVSEPLETLTLKGSSARLSGRDNYIAAIDKPWVTLMNFDKREVLKRFKPFEKRTTSLAFHPQDKWLAAGGQGDAIRIFSLPACEQSYEISQAHKGYVLSLIFSPDGGQLASTGYEQVLKIWDPASRGLQGEVKLNHQGIQSLAYSSDGGVLAVASDHHVTLVEAKSAEIMEVIELDPKGVYCLSFSPDGRWLACGTADKRVRIWEWGE